MLTLLPWPSLSLLVWSGAHQSGTNALLVAPGAVLDYEALLRTNLSATVEVGVTLRDAGVPGISFNVTAVVRVRVLNGLDPPRFVSGLPLSVAVSEGATPLSPLSVAYTASDDDGDAFAYTITQTPADPR